MSLYTRRGRVDVSTSDSEINSVASSGDQNPDEVVEELARMALAGHYYGSPKAYETNEMLRGHGFARRPRPSDGARTPAAAPSATASSAGPSPPLSARIHTRQGTAATHVGGSPSHASRSAAERGTRQRHGGRPVLDVEAAKAADVSRALDRMYRHLAREYAGEAKQQQEGAAASTSNRRGGSENGGGDDDDNDAPRSKKKRRPPDELALARLLAKNPVQEMRQKIPYHKIKEREEEERKHPKRIRVPQKAVILGKRLYLEAQEKRKTVKEMQEELEKQKAEEERKACTFHPSISRFATRLAAVSGHYTVEDRLEDQAIHDEELQRLRFERAVELERECTFTPRLSTGTEELIAQQRRRRRSQKNSRSRSGSGRRRHSSATSREPFEPGERLYRDGAERLLRQQIRLRRAAARQQHHVVGGQLRLSAEGAKELAGRFEAWAAAREERQAMLRDEADRLARTGAGPSGPSAAAAATTAGAVVDSSGGKRGVVVVAPAGKAGSGGTARRVLSRSPSAKSASTARPKNSPFTSRGDDGVVDEGGHADIVGEDEEAERDEPAEAEAARSLRSRGNSANVSLLAPPARSASPALSISQTSASCPAAAASARSASFAPHQNLTRSASAAFEKSAATASAAARSTFSRPTHGSARFARQEERFFDDAFYHDTSAAAAPVFDTADRKTQLRIRLGALFFKYAVTPTASTVSPAEVQRQVQGYYPEDAGVAAALDACYDDEHQRLTKHEFMAALARYVAEHGPQPWCFPCLSHQVDHADPALSLRTSTSDKASSASSSGGAAWPASTAPVPAPAAATAAGDFLERLNAPTSSMGSSTKSSQKRAQPPLRGTTCTKNHTRDQLTSSSKTSNAPSSHAAASSPTELVEVLPHDAMVAVMPTDSGVPPSVEVSASCDAAAAADTRPLRTHIYRHHAPNHNRHRAHKAASDAPLEKQHTEAPPAEPMMGTRSAVAVTTTNTTNTDNAHFESRVQSYSSSNDNPPPAAAVAVAKHRRPVSRTVSPSCVPAALLVHGYQGHVARHRRSLEHAKTAVTEARHTRSGNSVINTNGAGDGDDGECTFQPTLNRRSVALSERNLEKRMRYAHELQLRRQELQVLRESVLKAAAAGTSSGEDKADAKVHFVNATAAAAASSAVSATTPRRQVTLQESPRPRGGVTKRDGEAVLSSAAQQGQSPSIDLSTLSSVTAQGEASGATPLSTPSPTAQGVAADEATQRNGGEEATEVVDHSPKEAVPVQRLNENSVQAHAPIAPLPQSQPGFPHFHATKPVNAILVSDDALTPRRAALRLQQQQQQQQ